MMIGTGVFGKNLGEALGFGAKWHRQKTRCRWFAGEEFLFSPSSFLIHKNFVSGAEQELFFYVILRKHV